jgi:hypothetical protein
VETVTHRVVYTCDVCRTEATALDYVLSNGHGAAALTPALPAGWVERREPPKREHFCSSACETTTLLATLSAASPDLRLPPSAFVACHCGRPITEHEGYRACPEATL